MCISVAFRTKLQYNLIKVYKLFSLHYALLVLWLLVAMLCSKIYVLLPGAWKIAICISIIAIFSKLVCVCSNIASTMVLAKCNLDYTIARNG